MGWNNKENKKTVVITLKILGAPVKVISRPGFVQPCSKIYHSETQFSPNGMFLNHDNAL